MSYKYDVVMLLKEKELTELNKKIMIQGFEDEELTVWLNLNIYYTDKGFMVLKGHYVRWDSDTEEVAQIVEEYFDMLEKNNIPSKFIKVGEFGETTSYSAYGIDPNDIPIINSVYAKTNIETHLDLLLK